MKAADYGTQTKCRRGFRGHKLDLPRAAGSDPVAARSLQTGQEIAFAHTSFKWANLASHNAGVIVVIVGISNLSQKRERLYSIDADGSSREKICSNINAYLSTAQTWRFFFFFFCVYVRLPRQHLLVRELAAVEAPAELADDGRGDGTFASTSARAGLGASSRELGHRVDRRRAGRTHGRDNGGRIVEQTYMRNSHQLDPAKRKPDQPRRLLDDKVACSEAYATPPGRKGAGCCQRRDRRGRRCVLDMSVQPGGQAEQLRQPIRHDELSSVAAGDESQVIAFTFSVAIGELRAVNSQVVCSSARAPTSYVLFAVIAHLPSAIGRLGGGRFPARVHLGRGRLLVRVPNKGTLSGP